MINPDPFGRLLALAEKQVGVGASISLIRETAEQLGVRLPNSYTRFLQEFGWCAVESIEINGVGEDVPKHLDLRQVTASERSEAHPILPSQLLPLMNDGFGNHYCLDTNEFTGSECPVVFWDHEAGTSQVPEKIAKSFEVWLSELLDRLSDAHDS